MSRALFPPLSVRLKKGDNPGAEARVVALPFIGNRCLRVVSRRTGRATVQLTNPAVLRAKSQLIRFTGNRHAFAFDRAASHLAAEQSLATRLR